MPSSDRLPRPIVFFVCLAPLIRLGADFADGSLAANPMPAVIKSTGLWSLRLLIAGLLLSPLGAVTGWPWPGRIRRMVGLFAAFYAGIHLAAWARYYDWDWKFLAAEAVEVPFLAIGLFAAILLLAMTLTSPQSVHAALGSVWWRRIHSLIYPAIIAVWVHDLMARRFDRAEAAIMGCMIAALIAWRLGLGRRAVREVVLGVEARRRA